MQYEDFQALELEAQMIEEEENWLSFEDERCLAMVEEWEKHEADRRYGKYEYHI